MKNNKKRKSKKGTSSVSAGFVIFTLLLLVVVAIAVFFIATSNDGEESGDSGEESQVMNQSSYEETSNASVESENSKELSGEEKSEDSEASEDASEEPSEESSEISDAPTDGKKYAHVSWFIAENGKRYDSYGEKNPAFTPEQVVTYVNIGLDGPYYTNTYKAKKEDGNFILVNKYSYVDRNFTPDNLVELDSSCKVSGKSVKLVKEAADAFKKLSEDAAALEYYIIGMSGYRTYAYQESLYNRYLQSDTKENVDKYSARPGYSEHHTGLALDVQTKTHSFDNFGQTPEYEWLLDNAHRYGFVIHYTTDNQWITGYMPEEWHIRYLGVEAATYIYDHNLSVDEYLVMFGAKSPEAMG